MFFRLLLGTIVFTSLLNGCVPALLVGAGAAGGYYVGRDQRDTTRIVLDADINAKVNSAYFAAPDIDAFAINVAVYQGVVTLSGEVPSQGIAQRAIQLAQHTRGVVGVVSNLIIVAPER